MTYQFQNTKKMHISSNVINIQTEKEVDLIDLTEHVKAIMGELEVSQGYVTVSSRHTTTAIYVNEFESRLLDDIKAFISRLAPKQEKYAHNDIHLRDCPKDEPENAHSHLQAMLLGNSETVPIVDGKLSLGKWQSIILAELDGPRRRTVNIQIIYQ